MAHYADEMEQIAQENTRRDEPRVTKFAPPSEPDLRLVEWGGDGPDPIAGEAVV